MNKETIIHTKGLKKTFISQDYEQCVFHDLDLDLYKGDFTVIMGPSGSGKSTLLYTLSGMDKPTEGSVYFNGKDIAKLKEDELAEFRRTGCGFVFQKIHLLDKMSLIDNIVTAGKLTQKDKKKIQEKASALFSKVDLDANTYRKFPSQVSGGQAQRAGIVRALINEPAVVFADEPTGALNSKNSLAILEIFKELHDSGQTVIMVTHDRQSALFANRILYLKDGQIAGECRLENNNRKEQLDQFLADMEW